MQICFVGCGDALGSGGRFNTCFHVTGERANFLIDCGASSRVARKHHRNAPDAHAVGQVPPYHAHHIPGSTFFPISSPVNPRARPLVVAGPEGIEMRLTQAMEVLFENSSKTKPKFDLSIVALRPEQPQEFGALRVTPFPVVHGESGGPFLAYRIEAEGHTIAYSADTEWTETLVPAARGADLFICEAYYYDRIVKNHLSLKTLEEHLPRIAPKKLVLTHMSEDMLERVGSLPYTAASDGMIIDL